MSPNDPLASSTNGAAGSKRKRSVSPEGAEARSAPRVFDVDPERKRERERQLAIRQAEEELAGAAGTVKVREDPKVEVQRMAATKAGGAYMPPHRLRAIMGRLLLCKEVPHQSFSECPGMP